MGVLPDSFHQMAEQVVLYTQSLPKGEPLPINIAPISIPDGTPTDLEVWDAARDLTNRCSSGTSKMRAEHIKEWLQGIQKEEDLQQNMGNHGVGDSWCLLMRLVTAVWETSTVPQKLGWIIVILIPKGGSNYPGIGLLEPFGKL
jgi:hypothetical protein